MQTAYNPEHGIDPQTIRKAVNDILVDAAARRHGARCPSKGSRRAAATATCSHGLGELPSDQLERLIRTLEEEMHEAAADLRFEYAARLRDEINDLKKKLHEIVGAD